MKVLWFSLSPCNSIKRDNSTHVIQGWMISLENEIKKCKDIQLEVAFFTEKAETPFEFEGVKYYPMRKYILNQNIGLNRIIERSFSSKKKDKKALEKMLEVVKQSNPDIIHIHGTEACFGLIQDIVRNIPIVFSIQGLIAPYTEKFFSGISFSDAKRYESFIDKIKQVSVVNNYKSFLYRSVRENHFLSKANYIFGRTFWDRDCTLALNPKRKYYVVNEILRPEFYTKHWKGYFSVDNIKIISVITAGFYKGMETLLKTAVILKKYSNLSFEWHVVGFSNNDKYIQISEKVTHIKSNNYNIIYHGKLDAEHLSDLLCESDIYVHVSHIENSPNSVCEAMILGMPVIASYAGGTASMLTNKKDGILVQDGDPYVLSGAILDYVNHPELAFNYAQSAKSKALARHNRENIINELLTAYKDIINCYNNI